MMERFHGYQLSLDQVDEFIQQTRRSRYFIRELHIHGMGEPLLWKHFNVGVQRLAHSGIIGRILVISNGQLLDRIEAATWRDIYLLAVDVYPNMPHALRIEEAAHLHPGQVHINRITTFCLRVTNRHPHTIPCRCGCPGPMYADGRIFFQCGPGMFEAARLTGENPMDLAHPIGPDYLKEFDQHEIGCMALCEYCNSNTRIETTRIPHTQRRMTRSGTTAGAEDGTHGKTP